MGNIAAPQTRLPVANLAGAAAGLLILAGLTLVVTPREARALPSYARQTGQPCGACHTDFPQLTPFGRRFKIGGYTLGGGDPKWPICNSDAEKAQPLPTKAGPPPPENTCNQVTLPPISMMAIGSFTHTAAPNPNISPQNGFLSYLHENDNFALDAFSAFYGGAVTDHVGAFVQMTFTNPKWHWDNTDLRWADTAKIGDLDIIYGLDGNNNPTVQDPWNTTPAFSYAFQSSGLMKAPGPAFTPVVTIIDGHFAQEVWGIGGYVWINDAIYLEATSYKSFNANTLQSLGIAQNDSIDTLAPYFRVAFEPRWGNNTFEIGSFGLIADVNPQPLTFFGAGGTDHYTDIGFDSTYQYQGDDWWLTLKAMYIHQDADLTASSSPFVALASNATDQLSTFRAQASLAYGNESKYVFTAGYFSTTGTQDPLLYGVGEGSLNNSPNTNGFVFELDYIPFGMTKAPFWPWFNARLGIQYVMYNEYLGATTNYDGMGTNARDNNTLYLYAWLAW